MKHIVYCTKYKNIAISNTNISTHRTYKELPFHKITVCFKG